ncbi:hypothetical protein ACQCP7_26110, partial [Ralstonia pseudosolanacearum]|uniref:hypothetical protein n=1 Tax=Ralstonia pseudosolanacearum TaxID=1310165 RepID=UPI003CF5901C
GNTEVKVYPSIVSLDLFGNEIAHKYIADSSKIYINFKGFKTKTTVDRLEALTGLKFSIAKGELCYFRNDEKVYINSDLWYEVKHNGEETWLELSK